MLKFLLKYLMNSTFQNEKHQTLFIICGILFRKISTIPTKVTPYHKVMGEVCIAMFIHYLYYLYKSRCSVLLPWFISGTNLPIYNILSPFTLSFLFYSYNDFVIQIYIMEVMILNFNQFENQNFLTVIQVIHLKI